jgi:hypothetical protein
MKKEIRAVSEGVLRVTTVDERWYARPTFDASTGLPRYEFVPSVTWITGFYPKGVAFYKWLAGTGWDEAEAIKSAAGDKGSKVHHAIGDLLDGRTVGMDDLYVTPTTGLPEPLTLEEYDCLMGFAGWHAETRPETVAREEQIWNEECGYAGTLDYRYRLGGAPWIVDFKSGQNVWPEHEIQVSAYREALPADDEFRQARLGILQVGYRRNKKRWKFTEVQPQFPLFLAARTIWAKETVGQAPSQKDYPLSLTLAPVPTLADQLRASVDGLAPKGVPA